MVKSKFVVSKTMKNNNQKQPYLKQMTKRHNLDFGLSAIKPANEKIKDKDSIPGSPIWMPPEAMLGREITEKCDVYSYGIVLWEIVTQQKPFPDARGFAKFRQDICFNHIRPPVDSIKLPSIRNLLNLCWHKDVSARPSFEEIIKILDVLLVESAINDEEGRNFWNENYLGKEVVPLDEFLPCFLEHFELQEPSVPDLECFKLLATTRLSDNIMIPIDVVKILQFGQFLDNFGPITSKREKENGKFETTTIFQRVSFYILLHNY